MKYVVAKKTKDLIILSYPDKKAKVIIKRKEPEEEELTIKNEVSQVSEVEVEDNPLDKDDSENIEEEITDMDS